MVTFRLATHFVEMGSKVEKDGSHGQDEMGQVKVGEDKKHKKLHKLGMVKIGAFNGLKRWWEGSHRMYH